MAETTWKQAVYDIADAYREAEGTNDKISIAQLKEKVRDGSSKVTLDGEKVKELEMTSYKGDNPLTLGQAGTSFPANTLLTNSLNIINGVNGEDLTDTAANQTAAVASLMAMVKRKVSENRGEGEYVWKKYENTPDLTMTVLSSSGNNTIIQVASNEIDLSKVDSSFFIGYTGNLPSGGNPHIITFKSASDVHILWGGTNNLDTTFTYNPSTKQITIVNAWSGTPTDVFEQTNKVFLDYVVSDDETAYPNGSTKDGYWYERVSEGVDLLTPMGYSKIAVDKLTFSSNTSPSSIPHSLGDVPSLAILLSKDENRPSTIIFGFSMKGESKYASAIVACNVNSYRQWYSGDVNNASASSVNIYNNYGTAHLSAGVEYTLITMA